jgi:FlaA1/EpsC-like NDP-sugar epimerase
MMINKFKSQVTQIFRKHSLPRWVVFMIDSLAVFVTFLFAYLLRFNLILGDVSFDVAFKRAYLVLGAYIIFMVIFKSFAGLIRHTTIKDTFNIFLTTTSSVIVLFLMSLLDRNLGWPPLFNIPISILLIHYGIITVFMFFFRVFIKMFYEFASSSSRERKNVIIYGAGEMGIIVKRVIEGDMRSGYKIVALIDDNWKLQGKKVDGIKVYSQAILTEEFISKEVIKVFIFAINNILPKRKKQILEQVITYGLEVLETPTFDTWLNGQLQIKQLRKVKFEDLLGRDPITLDLIRIEQGLNDKTIMVTVAAVLLVLRLYDN